MTGKVDLDGLERKLKTALALVDETSGECVVEFPDNAWGHAAIDILSSAPELIAAARERDDLRDKNAILRSAHGATSRRRRRMRRADNFDCEKAASALSTKLAVAQSDNASLRALLAQAEAALEPFKSEARLYDEILGIITTGDSMELWQDPSHRTKLCVGDLRRAREALAAIRKAKEPTT